MIELPEAFKKKMMGLLETEYEAFLESYEKGAGAGTAAESRKGGGEGVFSEGPVSPDKDSVGEGRLLLRFA